jgi:transcriptional regulator with XRE-family HTH domain
MADALPHPINTKKMCISRVRAGLSQAELARRCTEMGYRVSQQQVNRIERGTSGTTPATLKALAAALGLPVDDLLDTEAAVA